MGYNWGAAGNVRSCQGESESDSQEGQVGLAVKQGFSSHASPKRQSSLRLSSGRENINFICEMHSGSVKNMRKISSFSTSQGGSRDLESYTKGIYREQ